MKFGKHGTRSANSLTRPTQIEVEKAETKVHLGSLNIRLNGSYDIWRPLQQFEFDDAVLSEAIRQTFENRSTARI